MPLEIERRFLVTGDGWRSAATSRRLLDQGYLSVEPERTVRIRIAEDEAFLTIKGRKVGAAAPEFEYAIPLADAQAMLAQLPLCGRIRKHRHKVQYAGRMWEVDAFLDENAGLVIAELELRSEGDAFEFPGWAGAEVTGDGRYSNASLAVTPFSQWDAIS